MSHGYGFLTESSIIPKKSKQIKINDNSGQVLLESIIQKQKQKLKAGKKNQPIVAASKTPKRNPGIQTRMIKDQQQQQSVKLTQKNIYKSLENKASVYDKLANRKTNVSKLLTDFQVKQLQLNKDQTQQYEKARAAFYSGQIKNVEQQQKVLHQNVEAENSGTTDMRQRLTWEKQALNQLKGQKIQIGKPKVAQSFDNVFSKEERQAFQKVLNEQQQQKTKIQSIRRRKQLMEQERIRKLRKLNIIDDVGEAYALQKQEQSEDDEGQSAKKEKNQKDGTEK